MTVKSISTAGDTTREEMPAFDAKMAIRATKCVYREPPFNDAAHQAHLLQSRASHRGDSIEIMGAQIIDHGSALEVDYRIYAPDLKAAKKLARKFTTKTYHCYANPIYSFHFLGVKPCTRKETEDV